MSKNVSDLKYYEDFEIYFQDAVGFTAGLQLGFHRFFGPLDLGLELAGNYIHLPLKQGTAEYPYDYNVFVLPVTALVGYSF